MNHTSQGLKKKMGGTNRLETQLLWQETQSTSGRSEAAIVQTHYSTPGFLPCLTPDLKFCF